ncbi:hypothetical protein [Actinomyces radicidentis]|nr:hypothetical protein [Actinomyces radicidentis]
MRMMLRSLTLSGTGLLVLASLAACENGAAESTTTAAPEDFIAAAATAASDSASAGVAGAVENIAEQAPAIASAAPAQLLNEVRVERASTLDGLDRRADEIRPFLAAWAGDQLTIDHDVVETALEGEYVDAIEVALSSYEALVATYEAAVAGPSATPTPTATPLSQY